MDCSLATISIAPIHVVKNYYPGVSIINNRTQDFTIKTDCCQVHSWKVGNTAVNLDIDLWFRLDAGRIDVGSRSVPTSKCISLKAHCILFSKRLLDRDDRLLVTVSYLSPSVNPLFKKLFWKFFNRLVFNISISGHRRIIGDQYFCIFFIYWLGLWKSWWVKLKSKIWREIQNCRTRLVEITILLACLFVSICCGRQ